MFNLLKKKKPAEIHRELTDLEFEVSGVSYHKNSLAKLKVKNPEYSVSDAEFKKNYKKPIYQTYFINKPVKLIPEPSNKYNSDAVQVYIAGELVGYVPDDLCSQVKLAIEHRDVKFISAFIKGGTKIKYVEDGTVYIKEKNYLSINIRMRYI